MRHPLAAIVALLVAPSLGCSSDAEPPSKLPVSSALAGGDGTTFVVGRMVDGQFMGEVISGARPIEFFAERIDQATSGEPPQQ